MRNTVYASGAFAISVAGVQVHTQDSTNWVRYEAKATAPQNANTAYFCVYNYAVENTVTFQIRNVQLVDLTQYFNGDTTLINSITSWDDLVAYDPRFASYVEYNTGEVKGVTPSVSVNNGAAIASPSELFAVGNAADEYEVVSGVTTRNAGVVDLGTLNWSVYIASSTSYPYGYAYANVPGMKNGSMFICSKYKAGSGFSIDSSIVTSSSFNRLFLIDSSLAGKSAAQVATALDGVSFAFQTNTPTTSQSTPTQISLQAGTNVAMQTDGGRTLAELAMTYENLPTEG